MRWVWAAYRRGCFTGSVRDGLTREGFVNDFADAVARLLQSGGEAWIMSGQTSLGHIPVGLLIVEYRQVSDAVKQAWPEPIWFPEASPRNRLELMLKTVLDLKKEHLVLVLGNPASWTFLKHVCDFGVLRPVGKIRGYWADGTDAMQFQSVGS